MQLEFEFFQGRDAFEHRVGDTAFDIEPIMENGRMLTIDEFSEIMEFVNALAGSILGDGEKSVAVVENRRDAADLVDVVIDEETEIAAMPVGIENHGIEKEDVVEASVLNALRGR